MLETRAHWGLGSLPRLGRPGCIRCHAARLYRTDKTGRAWPPRHGSLRAAIMVAEGLREAWVTDVSGRLKTMPTSPSDSVRAPAIRCYTRALKNARHLQAAAPQIFAQDPNAEGFGTGVPVEILRGLHRLAPDSPALNRYRAVAEVLRTSPPPVPGRAARDALFSGTIPSPR